MSRKFSAKMKVKLSKISLKSAAKCGYVKITNELVHEISSPIQVRTYAIQVSDTYLDHSGQKDLAEI